MDIQRLIPLLLPLLILISSCSNNSTTQSQDGPQNEITKAFPRLNTKYAAPDSGKSRPTSYQFIKQEYYLEDENQLFTGTLTNNQWQDSLKIKGTFKDGKVQQVASWFPDGSKNTETTVQPDNEKIKYVTTTWYPAGELKSKYNNRTGKRYFKSGDLRTEWDETSVTDYWKNGQRRSYRSLKNSNRVSTLDGIFKTWHSNGELSAKGHFVSGKRDGKWIHRDSLGKVEKIVIYSNGERDSTITNP